MNPTLYQKTIFPIFDLLRGRHNMERLKFLRESQFWPGEKLEAWRLERLNVLLSQAKENSQFHRNRLDRLSLPLKSLEDLQRLPILTKDEIRAHREEIKCENIPASRMELGKTGGSTGEPMHYYYDKQGMDWNRGTVYRSQEWSGTYLGEKTVQMMGSHYDYTERKKLALRFMLWLQRYKDMPVAIINDDLLDRYYRELNAFRPTNLWGYSSGIYNFANFIAKNHPNSRFDFLKAIITSSETLFKHQRDKINQVFGDGKVYDHYGSREMYMASECREHSGYHIHAEVILLEIVGLDGTWKKPGEMGRVVLTDLSNHAFPFIRYEIGDVGVMSEEKRCPCGVTLPKLAKVEGRISDVVVLKDRVLTSPNFTILFSDHEGVDAYQVVQKTTEEIEIFVVKNSKFTQAVEEYLKKSLQHLLGPATRFKINYPSSIQVPKSGKRRFVISEVSKNYV